MFANHLKNELIKGFDGLDTDKDGRITKDQIQGLLFDLADKNGDGEISKDELKYLIE